jgi:hypothetical protein
VEAPTWQETLNWQKVRDDYQGGVPLNILHSELFASNQAPGSKLTIAMASISFIPLLIEL